MRDSAKFTLGETLLGGLAVGYIASQALDVVSTYLYHHEDPAAFHKENEVRGGRHAYERSVQDLAKTVGVELDENQTRRYGWKFHRAFGIVGGVQYLFLRRVFPKIGLGGGLLFGVGFFLIVDEFLMAVTGWTPGPQKFPWQAHARGFAAHVAYGVAAETTARAYEYLVPTLRQATAYARHSSEYEGHASS